MAVVVIMVIVVVNMEYNTCTGTWQTIKTTGRIPDTTITRPGNVLSTRPREERTRRSCATAVLSLSLFFVSICLPIPPFPYFSYMANTSDAASTKRAPSSTVIIITIARWLQPVASFVSIRSFGSRSRIASCNVEYSYGTMWEIFEWRQDQKQQCQLSMRTWTCTVHFPICPPYYVVRIWQGWFFLNLLLEYCEDYYLHASAQTVSEPAELNNPGLNTKSTRQSVKQVFHFVSQIPGCRRALQWARSHPPETEMCPSRLEYCWNSKGISKPVRSN